MKISLIHSCASLIKWRDIWLFKRTRLTYTRGIQIREQYTYFKSLKSSRQSRQRLYFSRIDKVDHRYIIVESDFVSQRFRNRLRVISKFVVVIARRTFAATLMNRFCWNFFAVERCWNFVNFQRIHFRRSFVMIFLFWLSHNYFRLKYRQRFHSKHDVKNNVTYRLLAFIRITSFWFAHMC